MTENETLLRNAAATPTAKQLVTFLDTGVALDLSCETLLGALQQALRKELPTALAKELPRALGSEQKSWRKSDAPAASSCMSANESYVDEVVHIMARGEGAPDHPETRINQVAGFNAKKFYNEFSCAALEPSVAHLQGDEGESSRGFVARRNTSQDLRKGQMVLVKNEVTSREATRQARTLQSVRGGLLGRVQDAAVILSDMYQFTILTTTLIALNAVVIGIQTDWMASNNGADPPMSYKIIELVFCIAFTVELSIRLIAYRWFFFIHDWQWNLFDSSLVVLQIVEVATAFAVGDNAGRNGPNVSFMRILRVLRLVRVMRLVRVVRYISELRTIIASVFNSLKALFFTILLIFFLIFIMSVTLTQLVAEHHRGSDPSTGEVDELRGFFGSVPWSCLVLFQMITNGIDWADVATPLTKQIHFLMAPFLCLYVAFAQFAMLNVITGVFVESALASDAEEKDCTMVSRLMDFLSGSEKKGEISWDEFQARLDDPTIQLYFKSVDLDPSEARTLFMLLDADRAGKVDAEEFIMGCLRLRGSAKAIDLATLMYESRRWFRRCEKELQSLRRATGAASASFPRTLEIPLPPEVPLPPKKTAAWFGSAEMCGSESEVPVHIRASELSAISAGSAAADVSAETELGLPGSIPLTRSSADFCFD